VDDRPGFTPLEPRPFPSTNPKAILQQGTQNAAYRITQHRLLVSPIECDLRTWWSKAAQLVRVRLGPRDSSWPGGCLASDDSMRGHSNFVRGVFRHRRNHAASNCECLRHLALINRPLGPPPLKHDTPTFLSPMGATPRHHPMPPLIGQDRWFFDSKDGSCFLCFPSSVPTPATSQPWDLDLLVAHSSEWAVFPFAPSSSSIPAQNGRLSFPMRHFSKFHNNACAPSACRNCG
jgi:hypothetical protein